MVGLAFVTHSTHTRRQREREGEKMVCRFSGSTATVQPVKVGGKFLTHSFHSLCSAHVRLDGSKKNVFRMGTSHEKYLNVTHAKS